MPFVRCKFYTESGEPLRGGCHKKGTRCPFVHPGDSDWTNAPPSSFRARDKNSDTGGFKSWSERSKYAAATHSAWDTKGNAGSSTADTGSGWDTGGGWDTSGGWDTGGGWDTSGGWDTGGIWDTGGGLEPGGSISTPNHVLEPPRPRSPSATKSSNEDGWGWGVDKAMGSTWGSSGNDGPGGSSSKENKDAGSGWGSTQNDGWGTGWKGNAGSTWGSKPNDGWGDDNNATSSWGAPDPMIVDNPAEKKTEQNKKKDKAVLPPPRIRIPGNGSKKPKITGSNNESLGSTNRWGESRCSNLLTTPTLVTSTSVAVSTPTDSSHVKRKRDAAFDDKSDVFKDYAKAWERGVRARFLLAEAEAKRDRWFRTQKSPCYARIGEAGRKRLDGQRAECDKEVSSQREKLSCAITSLVGFHDTISANLDLGRRYNVGEETKKFIDESKAFVDEVRAILAEHVLENKTDVRLGDTQKRPPRAAAYMDSLRSQVQDLEERFEQTQAELTLYHQRDIRSEIDELLTAKIADLRVARQQDIDRVGSQLHSEITIPPAALKNLEGTAQQARELDAKVPRTAEDIRVLLLRVDATTKRVSELEGELLVNKETYRKMQEMATDKEETERKVDERLEKIREQYEQLVASQLCGPVAQPGMSSTTYNSQHELMDSLRPAFETMLDKFYEREVRPTVESLQQAVIEASDRHQEEAIKVLWGRIQPAMNMVAGVSRWLDSQELGFTAPTDDLEGRPLTT